MRFLASILALALGAAAHGQRVTVPTGLSSLAAIYWNAQGTYSASTLPKMCVNGHVATATAAQTLTLLNALTSNSPSSVCTRIDWNWDVIETVSGTYNWAGGFSAYFGTLCAAGVPPIFLATYNNALYASGVDFAISSGSNTNAFANFNTGLANEAAALACPNAAIEEFNEANLPKWTNSLQWTGSQYAPVLTASAAASKAAQAAVKVISSGVTPGNGTAPAPWIAQAVSAGSSVASVDHYGLHPYSYNIATPSLTPLPDQAALDTQTFWLYAGSTAHPKPIAITEYGFPWDAFGSSVTQGVLNTQGVYIGWAMLATIAANVTLGSPGVSYFAVYDIVDDGTNYVSSDQNSFGLFFNGSASSGSPITGASAYGIKPAGTAFKSVTGAMAAASSYSISYDIANSAPTVAFVNSLGTNFAIWTTDASSSKSWSKAIGSFSSVTCKDLIGNTVTCPYSAGNLSATLSTSTGPIIATALN